MSKNRLLQIVNKLGLTNKDKSDLVNIIDTGGNGGGNSSNKELYAYPVDTLDGKENKVVGLGGNEGYVYVGELVASGNGPTEGELTGEVFYTEYYYQLIYDGKYIDDFDSNFQEKYITLYIGNDVDGYSSNKVYMSEDSNNLTYYDFYFIGGFGPRTLKVAISPDFMLHYKNYVHYAHKNSKVFFAINKQQLDVNLIPQEIVRKKDIAIETKKAIIDYNTSSCRASFINSHEGGINARFGLYIYLGELGAKSLIIDNYIEGKSISFQHEREDEDHFYYSSDVADIIINKKTNVLKPGFDDTIVHGYSVSLKKLIAQVKYSENTHTFDFSNVNRTLGKDIIDKNKCQGIRFYFEMGYLPHENIIDSAYFCYNYTSSGDKSFYCVYLRNKYIEFKIIVNRDVGEYNIYNELSLEIIKEIDIPSLESRLAALEAKN